MNRHPLWTKIFLVGTLVNFFLLLNYYLLMVIMAEYAAEIFHVSGGLAGAAASLFIIGILLARFFSANLMERIGSGRLLLIGALLEVVASVLYFLREALPFCFSSACSTGSPTAWRQPRLVPSLPGRSPGTGTARASATLC